MDGLQRWMNGEWNVLFDGCDIEYDQSQFSISFLMFPLDKIICLQKKKYFILHNSEQ